MGDFNICGKNCRLCLRDEKFQIPIFGETGNQLQIALKIKTCLPIQVSKDDFLPKYICYKCLASLDHSYNLWKQSSESEALNERINKSKNRTILLSSGGTLKEDTDSENEGPSVIKSDNGSDDDHPPKNKILCDWPDGGDDDLMTIDSSPNFLESLEFECKQQR
ncbi:hypothetical protein L9F63_010002 [Diploptera punctata]|uniref:ZAD domain-containing protein n=1 Tax=Diploptera punctata TaxID=6984 RepID=A0AAD8EQL6_DIPPU|nr:hypothetical protein L9F63_010002 [Diploptera punctata]